VNLASTTAPPLKNTTSVSCSFDGLDSRLLRWVDYEQTVNERLNNEGVFRPIDHRSNSVKPHLRPEQRPVWELRAISLPLHLVRCYGPVDASLRAAFGLAPPKNCALLFFHPQPPAAQLRLIRKYGCHRVSGVAVTPTASLRSLVAWRRDGDGAPGVLKLSLGATVGGTRRAFRERQIAGGVVVSSVFETIPVADRERLGLDWFPELAGAVETGGGHGWLLRQMPRLLTQPGSTSLVPAFALISRRSDREPLLVSLIRRSKQNPETFLMDRLIRPYVNALAYLLFEHGLQHEGHTQNVLFEVDEKENLTGRLVLRDFSDASVNIAFRIAKGKPLPTFLRGFLPQRPPFPFTRMAADYATNFRRPRIFRGFDTVERYGLWGFVWPINTSVARFFKGYNSSKVERRYLELWQQAAIDYLGIKPLFRKEPKGLATDETIACFLREVDWPGLGAKPGTLCDTAEPLLVEGRMRRRPGRLYQRLECAWGDLFISDGLPGFFRPAF